MCCHVLKRCDEEESAVGLADLMPCRSSERIVVREVVHTQHHCHSGCLKDEEKVDEMIQLVSLGGDDIGFADKDGK